MCSVASVVVAVRVVVAVVVARVVLIVGVAAVARGVVVRVVAEAEEAREPLGGNRETFGDVR